MWFLLFAACKQQPVVLLVANYDDPGCPIGVAGIEKGSAILAIDGIGIADWPDEPLPAGTHALRVHAHGTVQVDTGAWKPPPTCSGPFAAALGVCRNGVYVNAIEPGSPAALARLLPGDHVVAVDGGPVTMPGLSELVRAGGTHRWTVVRGTSSTEVTITTEREGRAGIR